MVCPEVIRIHYMPAKIITEIYDNNNKFYTNPCEYLRIFNYFNTHICVSNINSLQILFVCVVFHSITIILVF